MQNASWSVVCTPYACSVWCLPQGKHSSTATASASVVVEKTWWVDRVFVDEGHRNKGLGSKALDEMKAAVAAAGCKNLVVLPGGYDPERQPDRVRFYEKNGFVCVSPVKVPELHFGDDSGRVWVWRPQ